MVAICQPTTSGRKNVKAVDDLGASLALTHLLKGTQNITKLIPPPVNKTKWDYQGRILISIVKLAPVQIKQIT